MSTAVVSVSAMVMVEGGERNLDQRGWITANAAWRGREEERDLKMYRVLGEREGWVTTLRSLPTAPSISSYTVKWGGKARFGTIHTQRLPYTPNT